MFGSIIFLLSFYGFRFELIGMYVCIIIYHVCLHLLRSEERDLDFGMRNSSDLVDGWMDRWMDGGRYSDRYLFDY